ncbi:4-hydroxythreonine-4-phosphate dehydrogenase PdxA [bacterium]|nr:hypothetical protein [bacterium]MBU3956137.1 4-hydroxythreonine-4-phosphate dehydrogenase PdxA [bacterium]
MNKTVLITSGDPAGVGGEVILRLAANEIFRSVPSLVAGRKSIYEKLASDMGFPVDINLVDNSLRLKSGALNIIEPACENKFIYGAGPGEASSREALAYLELACGLIKDKAADKLITAPVSKEGIASLREDFSGPLEIAKQSLGLKPGNLSDFSGHTYYLADFFGVERKKAVMLFLSRTIRVVLVTQHLPLKDVSSAINKEAVVNAAVAAGLAGNFMGIEAPRIAVCSLNPHCGDGGILGLEEKEEIIPAVEELQKRGIHAYGPMSAEDASSGSLKNKYDFIVAMYHDQGILPVKLFSHGRAINFTWGLPFIRVSPLHGTAFDIAGQFIARAESMIECFRVISELK